MSRTFIINGFPYPFPETGAEDWGDYVTEWAEAVTNNLVSKQGGSFLLEADLDFGPNYGLKLAYIKSKHANPAGSGYLRLGNTESIGFRNSTNTGDLLLSVDGDLLKFNNKHLITDVVNVNPYFSEQFMTQNGANLVHYNEDGVVGISSITTISSNLTFSYQDGRVVIHPSFVATINGKRASSYNDNISITTDDIPEGTINKYCSDINFSALLATKTTDDLQEGINNKYYKDSRVLSVINTYKGEPNGIAGLDSAGKIPLSQLPFINEDGKIDSEYIPPIEGTIPIGVNYPGIWKNLYSEAGLNFLPDDYYDHTTPNEDRFGQIGHRYYNSSTVPSLKTSIPFVTTGADVYDVYFYKHHSESEYKVRIYNGPENIPFLSPSSNADYYIENAIETTESWMESAPIHFSSMSPPYPYLHKPDHPEHYSKRIFHDWIVNFNSGSYRIEEPAKQIYKTARLFLNTDNLKQTLFHLPNASDYIQEGRLNLFYRNSRVREYLLRYKDVPEGIPFLDVNGKIPVAFLPHGELGVTSINGKTGTVILDTGDIPHDNVNFFFTTSRFNSHFDPRFNSSFDTRFNSKITTLKGVPDGLATLDSSGKLATAQFPAITSDNVPEGDDNLYWTNTRFDSRLSLTKGVANGLATLNATGKIPSAQIPTGTGLFVEKINNISGPDVTLTADHIEENPSTPVNRYFTETRARNSVDSTAPLTYNSSTGKFGIQQANLSQDGYLASSHFVKFATDSANGMIEKPTDADYNGDYYLTINAEQSGVIESLTLQTLSGNVKVSLYINDVVVTGLSNITATSTKTTSTATANQNISIGDVVKLTISDATLLEKILFTLKYRKI